MEKFINRFRRPPSRLGSDVTAYYVTGDCNVCHQRGVKVKKLECGEHNCCRMCVDFVPRLVKGDYSCRICDRTTNIFDDVSKKQMEKIFSGNTAARTQFDDMTVTVDGNVILCEDGGDNEDLGGYNEEWDHLLTAGIADSKNTPIPRSDDISRQNKTTGAEKIPRKPSILRLGLQSADNSPHPEKKVRFSIKASEPSSSAGQPMSGLVATGIKHVILPVPHDKVPQSFKSMRAAFELDPDELERGTSPCKARPSNTARLVIETIDETDDTFDQRFLDSSQSETEQLLEEIGSIDGPGFEDEGAWPDSDSSSTCETPNRKLLFDEDYWDLDF